MLDASIVSTEQSGHILVYTTPQEVLSCSVLRKSLMHHVSGRKGAGRQAETARQKDSKTASRPLWSLARLRAGRDPTAHAEW